MEKLQMPAGYDDGLLGTIQTMDSWIDDTKRERVLLLFVGLVPASRRDLARYMNNHDVHPVSAVALRKHWHMLANHDVYVSATDLDAGLFVRAPYVKFVTGDYGYATWIDGPLTDDNLELVGIEHVCRELSLGGWGRVRYAVCPPEMLAAYGSQFVDVEEV